MNMKRSTYYVLAVSVMALAAIIGTNTSTLSKALPRQEKQLVNKTQALQISTTTTEVRGLPQIDVKLINKSKKGIVACGFVIGSQGQTMVMDGALGATDIVAPQGIESTKLLLSEKGFVPELSAIIFEDGRGEGDTKAIAYLKDVHRGVKEQFNQSLQIIKTEQVNSSLPLSVRLQNLQEKLSVLPEQQSGLISSRGLDSGLTKAKQFLVQQIQELNEEMRKGNDTDIDTNLNRMISSIEKALRKLEKEEL